MIEPTDEMIQAFRTSGPNCSCCTDDPVAGVRRSLAAVLAIVERDYRLIRKPGTARPRRLAPVAHDPEALQWARKRAGWRQAHLAKALGISPSLLCEAEKGTRGLTAAVLARAAAVLNCPVTALERKAGAS